MDEYESKYTERTIDCAGDIVGLISKIRSDLHITKISSVDDSKEEIVRKAYRIFEADPASADYLFENNIDRFNHFYALISVFMGKEYAEIFAEGVLNPEVQNGNNFEPDDNLVKMILAYEKIHSQIENEEDESNIDYGIDL